MTNNTPSAYFDRAKALQEMILNAQEDLKQLRADALEELGVENMPKEQAKEIRKDLAEVFAVAKIEVKGEIERRNQAAKMARRKRIAEECGVQLDLLNETPAAPARRMARAAATAEAKGARGGGFVGQVHDKLVEAGFEHQGGNRYSPPPHDPETGDEADGDSDEHGGGSECVRPDAEPATVHAGGMNDRDWQTLGDIPDFLRR